MERKSLADDGRDEEALLLELEEANASAMHFVEEERRRLRDFSFLRLAAVLGGLILVIVGIAKIL